MSSRLILFYFFRRRNSLLTTTFFFPPRAGLVTNEGPATNWGRHVANPFEVNAVSVLAAGARTPVL